MNANDFPLCALNAKFSGSSCSRSRRTSSDVQIQCFRYYTISTHVPISNGSRHVPYSNNCTPSCFLACLFLIKIPSKVNENPLRSFQQSCNYFIASGLMGSLGLENIMWVSWQHRDVFVPWRLIPNHLQTFAGNFLVIAALSFTTLTYETQVCFLSLTFQ